jgi:hypothetical protein
VASSVHLSMAIDRLALSSFLDHEVRPPPPMLPRQGHDDCSPFPPLPVLGAALRLSVARAKVRASIPVPAHRHTGLEIEGVSRSAGGSFEVPTPAPPSHVRFHSEFLFYGGPETQRVATSRPSGKRLRQRSKGTYREFMVQVRRQPGRAALQRAPPVPPPIPAAKIPRSHRPPWMVPSTNCLRLEAFEGALGGEAEGVRGVPGRQFTIGCMMQKAEREKKSSASHCDARAYMFVVGQFPDCDATAEFPKLRLITHHTAGLIAVWLMNLSYVPARKCLAMSLPLFHDELCHGKPVPSLAGGARSRCVRSGENVRRC